jgi:hypothetical protein
LNQNIQSVQEKLRNEEKIHEDLSEQIELLSFQLYLRKMKLINTLQITFQKIILYENKMEEINARTEKYLIEMNQSLLYEDDEWMQKKTTELEQLKIRWKDKLLQRDSNYQQRKSFLEKQLQDEELRIYSLTENLNQKKQLQTQIPVQTSIYSSSSTTIVNPIELLEKMETENNNDMYMEFDTLPPATEAVSSEKTVTPVNITEEHTTEETSNQVIEEARIVHHPSLPAISYSKFPPPTQTGSGTPWFKELKRRKIQPGVFPAVQNPPKFVSSLQYLESSTNSSLH